VNERFACKRSERRRPGELLRLRLMLRLTSGDSGRKSRPREPNSSSRRKRSY
jgi:hypothetical protein